SFHRRLIRHAFDGDVVDFAGCFARDNQPGATLAELDPVGDVDDSVQHTQTRIAHVVNERRAAHTQACGYFAGRGRFELLAAHSSIDQDIDVIRTNVGRLQRLSCGSRGT